MTREASRIGCLQVNSKLLAVKVASANSFLGSKSHLRSFAQVLCQHYEVDQRLRVTAVLKAEERQTETNRESHLCSVTIKQQKNRVEGTQSNASYQMIILWYLISQAQLAKKGCRWCCIAYFYMLYMPSTKWHTVQRMCDSWFPLDPVGFFFFFQQPRHVSGKYTFIHHHAQGEPLKVKCGQAHICCIHIFKSESESNCATDQQTPGPAAVVKCYFWCITLIKTDFCVASQHTFTTCYTMKHRLRGSR